MTRHRFRRTPGILAAPVGQELVLLDRRSKETFELSAVAASVWRDLDCSRTSEELVGRLSSEYEIAPADAARDLETLLADLQALDLIRGSTDDDQGSLPVERASVVQHSRRAEQAVELPGLADELRLVVACCRWTFGPSSASQVRVLSARVDWATVLRLADYHRVQGLVWKCLSDLNIDVPEREAEALAAQARKIAATNLRSCAECADLRRAFPQCGKEAPVFLKGLTVGRLAYDDPFAKMGWDIDLLISPADLQEAVGILKDRGFKPVIPTTAKAVASWHSREKESVWTRDSDGLAIELHTRLADNLALIPSIGIGSPRQDVEVAPGVILSTLSNDELLAYLAVHGASSAWFRLKWISDFAALLSRHAIGDIDRIYDRSQQLGAGRAMSQALLLADRLFGSLGGADGLRRELLSDRASRWLAEAALRLVTGPPIEPTARRLGTLSIHWSQFLLLRGLSFKASELRRQAMHLFSRPGC